MKNWAKVNSDNIVVDVQVYEDDVTPQAVLPEGWLWVLDDETVKNDAGIGNTYDATRQAFIGQCKFKGWVLNEETCGWEPPVPAPNQWVLNEETDERESVEPGGSSWIWDNDTESWTELS
jgi:hypothetical protein